MPRIALLLALLVAVLAAPARAADTTIAEVPESVALSAHAGVLAYSRRDDRGHTRTLPAPPHTEARFR
jgi:hypothetical protein